MQIGFSSQSLDLALANIKTLQFDFEDRATFFVKYVYHIQGEQTESPENLKVEASLPLIEVTRLSI